ncbi:hypothetical protein LPJ53_000815 [Coemansia erecta]|uniref:Calcium/proton exchanger n=1 Tax=Coemansia erecta TaxID=147472 RepID=A0A9W8CUR4_9FUNG|nr:hypothetical protein LPJ53_000815 [Coemansia erecta]
MTTSSQDGQEARPSQPLSPAQARQHHQHHRHHSRRSYARRQSHADISAIPEHPDPDSDGSESGSTSCSTASSYSVDYGDQRGHGRRHRHHRVSYADGHRRSMGGRRRADTETSSSSDSRRQSTESSSSGMGPGEDEQNVRARQEALNTRHPFGLPIWKPALYKKSRSVTRAAFLALHARPLRSATLYLRPGNLAWMLLAGWPLLLVCLLIAAVLCLVPRGGRAYARVAAGLGWYLLWPFGRYVERIKDDMHGLERCTLSAADVTDGASMVEEEEGLADEEGARLLGAHVVHASVASLAATDASVGGACAARRHAQFRRQTALGRAVFYVLLVAVLNPVLVCVSAVSWFAVFSIPMGKLTHTLARYLWRDPLSLHFRSGDLPTVKVAASEALAAEGSGSSSGGGGGELAPEAVVEQPAPTVLLCTNEAVGWYYYKYTVDGVNILFYNMLSVALFVLVAAFVIAPLTHHQHPLVQPGVLFPLCLVSTIPLAYFIGQAVSSISAQSSLGMGAVINATFGSIVEVILYSIALTQGKARLVEGALVGSLLAGLMLMPGTSMIAGGVKHKMQRFNAKSAEVTATLVIMSIIGAFAPTLFYHTFAVPEFECHGRPGEMQQCRQKHVNFLDDPFYIDTVRPFMLVCTAVLPLAYLIALWFSLKTHVKHIYSSPGSAPPNPIVRHVLELFRRTLGPDGIARIAHRAPRSRDDGEETEPPAGAETGAGAEADGPVPPVRPAVRISRVSTAYDPANAPSSMPNVPRLSELPRVLAADPEDQLPDLGLLEHVADDPSAAAAAEGSGSHGGHDAPNWSKTKSALILCLCTVAFSLIAEVLVDTVDVVIQELGIREKIIGLTLFALVPNVTEFMNAIAFAIQNNIALSIEISNAYTVQVALLQIPILVFFSAFYGVPDFVRPLAEVPAQGLRAVVARVVEGLAAAASVSGGAAEGHLPTDPSAYVFALLFPLWDVIAILFCVFLLTYMLIEGKANYFKGSILCLSYFVWMASYIFEPIKHHKSD